MPEGVEPTITDRDFTVATIAAPGGAQEEETDEEGAPEAPETEVINEKKEVRRHSFGPWKNKFNAEISDGKLNGEKVLVVKPQTYMNESGQSVGEILRFYKEDLSNLIVIYDELDLPAAKLRIKRRARKSNRPRTGRLRKSRSRMVGQAPTSNCRQRPSSSRWQRRKLYE